MSDQPIVIEMESGGTPEVRVFRVSGPLTLPNLFDFQAKLRSQPTAPMSILEMSGVPYIDSAGMGAVVNFYTHCERSKTRMAVAGVNGRVLELFKLTKVDTLIPMTETVEEAEGRIRL